jgi:hypothetical protein
MYFVRRLLLFAFGFLMAAPALGGVIKNPTFAGLKSWKTNGLAKDIGGGALIQSQTVLAKNLDTFLGTGSALQDFSAIEPLELDPPFPPVVVEGGSALRQVISVNKDDVIKFDWRAEFTPSGSDYDGIAFWALGGSISTLVKHKINGQNQLTGSGTVSFTALQAGQFILGFGVMDVAPVPRQNDFFGSDLRITSLSITSNQNNTIPEPGTALVFSLGILGCLLVRKRVR